MFLPSIELLIVILDIEEGVVSYSRNDIDDEVSYSVILYLNTNDEVIENYSINIHTLAHKCKEWLLIKNFVVDIYSFNFAFNNETEHRIKLLQGAKEIYYNDSCLDSEPEAIFKACQFILDI